MTDEAKTKLKSVAAEAGKGTVRGTGSTIGWGAMLWYFLVERTYGQTDWHILVSARRPADLGTWFIVGLLAALLTGWFRIMEQRHPNSIWSTLLLSQGAPIYQQGEPAPTPAPTVTVTTEGAEVVVTPGPVDAPPAVVPPPPVDIPPPSPGAPPLFSVTPDVAGDPPFTTLPPDVLGEVAEYAYTDQFGIVFNGEGIEDTDAPHGINTADDKVPPVF